MATNLTETSSWQLAIHETYDDAINSIISFAPELIGAIALLLVGWLVARCMRFFTKKTIGGFDSLFRKVSKQDHTHTEKVHQSYITILGQIVFWAVLLFFTAASANLLGWKMFAGWMDGIILFLPRLITGLLMILGGYLLSSVARSAILRAGNNENISQTPSLARLTQALIFFCAIVMGVEQVGLEMHFLTTALIVTLGVLLAGACLGFGLGAKTVVENTIGAQYLRKHCQVGEIIEINGMEGEILEIRQTCIIMDTPKGRAIIPAKFFNEQISQLSSLDRQASVVSEKKAEDS
ncbi:mechanosensitive ion channel family protein [Coraliomargarita sp. W4R53]